MNPLAYTTAGEPHWLEHVAVGALIRRAIWSATRGISVWELVLIAVAAVALVVVLSRLEWR